VYHRYWKDVRNCRKFLVKFAERKGFDPLVADNWYTSTANDILPFKGGRTILELYKGNFISVLTHVFPEIGLDEEKFKISEFPHKYWLNANHRKKWFLDFARLRNFDSLVPSNWYTIVEKDILAANNGTKILQYYKGNFIEALLELFPNIGLRMSEFNEAPCSYSAHNEADRKFFENFAREQNFDPLLPENWYSVPSSKILNSMGAKEILLHYKKSKIKALIDVFPEIGLQKTKFINVPRHHWNSDSNRKQFFIDFAHAQGFDPLVPTNWYSLKPNMVLESKSTSLVNTYYNGSFAEALIHLFPDLNLEKSKFTTALRGRKR